MNLIFGIRDFSSLVIEDMQPDQTFQGFTHSKGRMTVQQSGTYYIYAQAFFETYTHPQGFSYNRVALVVKKATVFTLMQSSQKARVQPGYPDYGNSFSGGIIQLNSGDEIYLKALYTSKLWVAGRHTYFGAYKFD